MSTGLTSNIVANNALLLVSGNMPPVQGFAPTFDASAAGAALQELYYPTVRAVARQFQYDFTRSTSALSLSGNAAPFPYSFEYLYPLGGVEVWQLLPNTFADPNNPLPVDWNVGNNLVSGVQSRVIWTNQANALVVLNNMPNENAWDDLFQEAVERLLASKLSIALFGKPDQAEALLQSGAAFEQQAEMRPD